MEHSFNIVIAEKYGMPEAVLYNHFLFWIKKNKANAKNYRDGKFWTYSSVKALCDLFPYMTKNQIEYALKKLIDNKVLVKAVYNDNSYDRTSWYAFCEEAEDLKAIANPYKKEDKKDENLEKECGNIQNGNSNFQKSISEKSEMEEENFQNGSSNFQKSHTDILTNSLTDTLTDNITNTSCEKNANDFTNPYGLLNYPNWNWYNFKQAYLYWYSLLTGKAVNDIIQTLSKRDIGSDKITWLENAFNKRKVNAGVAIFETLEYIAQNKDCQQNVYLRSSNYLDGVIMRLSDMRLAQEDGINTEGTGYYQNPTFDNFKY